MPMDRLMQPMADTSSMAMQQRASAAGTEER